MTVMWQSNEKNKKKIIKSLNSKINWRSKKHTIANNTEVARKNLETAVLLTVDCDGDLRSRMLNTGRVTAQQEQVSRLQMDYRCVSLNYNTSWEEHGRRRKKQRDETNYYWKINQPQIKNQYEEQTNLKTHVATSLSAVMGSVFCCTIELQPHFSCQINGLTVHLILDNFSILYSGV